MQARLHSVLFVFSVSSVFSVPSVANTLTHPGRAFYALCLPGLLCYTALRQHLHIDPVQSTRHTAAF